MGKMRLCEAIFNRSCSSLSDQYLSTCQIHQWKNLKFRIPDPSCSDTNEPTVS